MVETKVRNGKAARITRCLGKDCTKAITVENEKPGRIWLIWKRTMDINEIERSDQALLVAAGTKEIRKIFFCGPQT